VKAVLSLLLSSTFFLPTIFLVAGGPKPKSGETKLHFEKPQFEKSEWEFRARLDSTVEKPSFEKPLFEKEGMDKPRYERLQMERPIFERKSIESPAKREDAAKKGTQTVVAFPSETVKKWGRIKEDRRYLHVIPPRHELKMRKVPVVR
jgi:hypothetical protein